MKKKKYNKLNRKNTTRILEAMEYIPTAEIFVDGCCDNEWVGNGSNTGGWSVLIRYKGKEARVKGNETNTTNQRMELAGLTQCIPEMISRGIKSILITTDSMYVYWGINRKEKWQRKQKIIPNWDLWEPIYSAIDNSSGAMVMAKWVKGHSGHEENELCDTMAEEARKEATPIGFKI
jgi:ribonuclease HI